MTTSTSLNLRAVLKTAVVRAVARRDRVEADSGVAGDPVQLEQHARHVGLARHCLGDAKEVRGATLALLDSADVGRASTGKMAKWAPTLADLRIDIALQERGSPLTPF